MKQASTSDQHSFYSEMTKKEKSNLITTASLKMTDFMCLGCTTTGLSLNSRTFSKMLQTCPYLCGRHRVILEAEERYKKKLQKSSGSNNRHAAYAKILLTPVKKGKPRVETSFKSKQDDFQSILLTPVRKSKASALNRHGHHNTHLIEEYNLLPTYEK